MSLIESIEESWHRHHPPKPKYPPRKPSVRAVRFLVNINHKGHKHMTGLVQLSIVNAADNVTHRMVSVDINGSPTPIVFDDISGTVTFSCNPGDSCVVTDVDSNDAGSSLPSAPFTAVAPAPVNVPATPSVLGVTFTP